MLNNQPIDEIEWMAYLREHLPTSTTVTPEGDRMAMISPISRLPVDRIAPISKPITEISTAPATVNPVAVNPIAVKPNLQEQFRGGLVDRALITEVSAANLSKSQLAIKAKPEWQISAQQVYRQVPPVPMLSDPLQVGDFLIWPDPQEDSVEVSLPEKYATQLDDRVVKPLPRPIFIDERVNPIDRVKPVIRPGLGTIGRMNTPKLNGISINPALLESATLVQAMELKRARLKVRRAFFAAITPTLQAFHLTIRQGIGNTATTGSALITVSLYSQQSDEMLEKYRLQWTDALSAAGYGARIWRFLPVNLQKLQAFLEVDPQQLRAPVQVTINPSAGTATFLVELSTIGAQIWQSALETRQLYKIVGIARFTAKFYARTDDRLQIREQSVAANVANLLANCGPEHLEILPPTVALTTSLIVQSHAFVESIAVNWQPQQSGEVMPRRFTGGEGGTLNFVVLTDNLNTAMVTWDAQVKYRLPSWSIVQQQGSLSLANPTEIIKPGSSDWIREYTIYTVMMASQTQVATDLAEFEDIEIEASLTFNANYLKLPLSTTFQAKHLDVTEVPFPVLPGESPNQIGITVTTRSKSRNTILAAVQQVLQPDALLLNLKVFRNGQIEIRTSTDPIAESSIDGDLFELLNQLKER